MANADRRTAADRAAATGKANPQAIPDWIGRVLWEMGKSSPERAVFLERALHAVVEIATVLPTDSAKASIDAGSNLEALFQALQDPAVLSELEQFEPLASPLVRGLQAQRELLRIAGETLSAKEAGEVLGLSEDTVDRRREEGRLIAVRLGRRFAYPALQFSGTGVLLGLPQVLSALPDKDGWMQLAFLLSPNGDLEGEAPIARIQRGDVQAVVLAAQMFGEHGAR